MRRGLENEMAPRLAEQPMGLANGLLADEEHHVRFPVPATGPET